jgi:molybdopterin converting factor small subunit
LLSRLIEQFNIPLQMAHIVLVNGRFVEVEAREQRALVEGDVVSIWPPVAGG